MTRNSNELVGQSVAGCELIRELGRGTNGVVYLAKHKQLNRQVACKIISSDLQEDPDFLDNLFTEAANAAKLSHPNVIQALDAGDSDGIKYFMMEFVDGNSLEYIRTNSPEMISTEFLLNLSLQLAVAMDFAWCNHKMTHGDIKPGNIMLTREDRILKVGDLGLARSSNGATGDPADVMVTPLYAAPEIITQQQISPDPRSDIYSFGIMLYELFCGTTPFTGTVEELLQSHVYQMPKPLFKMNPDMDKELSQLIDSMISKNPEYRPKDWKALKVALQGIYNRLHPAVQVPKVGNSAAGQAPPILNQTSANNIGKSWSAEEQKKKTLLEKAPWLLPAALLVLILIALLSIVINLGLFK